MGASYDSSALSDTLNETRFLVGDTAFANDSTIAAHFDDAEVQYALDQNADAAVDAAIELLEVLATRYRQMANVSAGGQSISMGTMAQGFADQADRLRSRSTAGALTDLDTMRVDGYSDDLSALDVDAASSTHSDADHPYNENKL